ncbi:helix-turn-helix domain-containing protein [Arthrobacter sp. D1-17]
MPHRHVDQVWRRKFGKQPPKPDTVQTKVRVVRQLLSEGTEVKAAAEAVGWSRATLYRYLKEFGPEKVPESAVETRKPRSKSIYAPSRHRTPGS